MNSGQQCDSQWCVDSSLTPHISHTSFNNRCICILYQLGCNLMVGTEGHHVKNQCLMEIYFVVDHLSRLLLTFKIFLASCNFLHPNKKINHIERSMLNHLKYYYQDQKTRSGGNGFGFILLLATRVTFFVQHNLTHVLF
jgi:hypothetical protein